MRRRLPILVLATGLVSLAAFAVVACSSPKARKNDLPLRDLDDTGEPRENEPTTDDLPRKPEADLPLPDGGKPPGRIYAHTATTLYLFDPLISKLTRIGPFSCLHASDRMLDIALDRDGVMYGTSDDGFLKISPVDASCTYVKEDPAAGYPNSLSFVPIGTVDSTREALVGYQFQGGYATSYVRIDTNGEITPIGDLNAPGATVRYRSSGDLIALIRNGNKAYLTVKSLPMGGDDETDYLAEIDPTSGRILSILGDMGQKDLYGFAQWAGTGYGFDGAGHILEVNLATGASEVLMTLTEDGGVESWYGAGVTTDSPTKP